MTEPETPKGESTYDEVPYGASTHAATYIDRLATAVTLFGATPPAIDACRVLELGCARGANLLPMAVALPRSTFVGVDLSGVQIEDGKRTVASLGLPNVDLRHASILDVGPDYGEFDYIICHGVFSWVPSEVQDKILSICSSMLSTHGVAFISYNTYPGWHFRGMIRDMLLYHSERFDDPATRIAASRALLRFLAKASGTSGPYGSILNSELELVSSMPDYYIFHEHLESNNQPLYFHQFADMLGAFDLQYVGDADPRSMSHFRFPKDIQDVLRRLSTNVIEAEQYMDFLRNRTFRQSLLCRKDIKVSRSLSPNVFDTLRVASPATTESAGAASDRVEFVGVDKERLTTSDPVVKSALTRLQGSWPAAAPFAELVAWVAQELHRDVDVIAPVLGARLLRLYLTSRLVSLHTAPQTFVTELSATPTASPIARLQATSGAVVTNLKHESLQLTDLERQVLVRLDGKTSLDELAAALREFAMKGSLVATHNEQPVVEPAETARIVERTLPHLLAKIARAALLVG